MLSELPLGAVMQAAVGGVGFALPVPAEIDPAEIWAEIRGTGVAGIAVGVIGALCTALAYDAKPVLARFHVLGVAFFALLGAGAAIAGGMLIGPKIDPLVRSMLEKTVVGEPSDKVAFSVGAVLGAGVLAGLVMMLGRPPKPPPPQVEDADAKQRQESNDEVTEGLAMEALDDWESALESYEKALSIWPDNAIALGRCGLIRLRFMEDEQALEDLRRCAELDASLKPALEKEVRVIKAKREIAAKKGKAKSK